MIQAPQFDFDVYPPFEGFPNEGLCFFRQLKRNNTREWFEKHREKFEREVKLPMQSYIYELQQYFSRFAPEFDLNPKRSIFRLYRDIRFSADKTPYKIYIAAHFVLRGTPKGYVGSGYYIQVGPGETYVGGGIYIPDSDQLKKIRRAIAAYGKDFLAIVEDQKFKKIFFPFEWSKLQRIPRGFDENHPMAEWLKYKQFFVGVSWPESRCYRKSFVKETAAICETLTPLVRFLNKSLM
jgi:uncharacterized protein (TIGR02453 family)